MDIKDIAWAAGIYEGEGCFAGVGSKSRYVHVVQKDSWLCYKLKSLFGGSVHVYNGYYKWMLCGDEARGFLLTIFTFLSPRRKKVILEGKGFFKKIRCKLDLHDWTQSNIGVEFHKNRGRREFCKQCRIAHDERRDIVKRSRFWQDRLSTRQKWIVPEATIDEQFAFLDKIS